VLAAVCWLAARARAQPRPPDEQNAFLQLVVNEVPQGEVLAIVMEGDVLVAESDLLAAGLRQLQGGRRLAREGRTVVSLASLAPRLRYKVEDADLSLRLDADPSLLAPTSLDLQSGRPPGLVQRADSSLFINYALFGEKSALDPAGGVSTSGFAEGGLHLADAGLLYGSATVRPDHSVLRTFTSYTLDFPRRLLRLVVGDASVSTNDPLGGAAVLGGVNLGTSYEVDPYFDRFPALGFTGSAMSPSMLEVYVNGSLVRRQPIAPGPFTLQNLPATVGAGDTRVVVRDAFGHENTMNARYYLGPGGLQRGLSELNLALGLRRQNLNTSSLDYGGPAFLGTYRRGLRRWLTAGGRVEAAVDLASAGGLVSLTLPYGEAGAALAASRQRGKLGSAAAVYYSYTGRSLNVGLTAREQSPAYANLLVDAGLDRARLELRAVVGTSLFRTLSLSAQVQHERWRDRGRLDRVSLIGNAPLVRGLSAFVTTSGLFSPVGRALELFAGASFALGARSNALVGTTVTDEGGGRRGGTARAELQRSLPLGPGLGYALQADLGETATLSAEARAQGRHGRVEARVQRAAGVNSAYVQAAGGIVILGDSLFLTRPVDSSFALAQVPGVEGARVYHSNQEVGRTDSSGNLLVPNLQPYYGNRLSINDKDIPLSYDIRATDFTIAPPFRGGAVVRFPVRRIQSATGKVAVVVGGSRLVPSYGQITLNIPGRALVVSPINEEGAFYLEDVPAGGHRAEVEFKAGVCSFTLTVPESWGEAVVDLGQVACDMNEGGR
jgi:outer membrane usher protein